MPRLVLLRHELPTDASRESHWDLMLEQAETLRTWELLFDPRERSVVQSSVLPPHRKYYLDYEGPVSQNRGRVSRLDAGSFRWIEQSGEHLVVDFDGQTLRGRARWAATDSCWRFEGCFDARL